MQVMGRNCSLINAFNTANDVLRGAVQGIADLITRPGMINVDFADVRTVMSEMGMAMMGTGEARGDDRATIATEAAINSPLLEDVDLKGARGILVNITAGLDLSLGEFSEVGSIVEEYASENATIVVGTVIDAELSDEIKVTVVATGLGQAQTEELKVVNGGTTSRVVSSSPSHSHSAPSSSRSDFNQLDLPTVLRNRADERQRAAAPEQENDMMQSGMKKTGTDDMDFLDIPAFLRRQAD